MAYSWLSAVKVTGFGVSETVFCLSCHSF